MNPKIILIIQLILMGLFLYLIFGVFDAKKTSGLIGIGASMVVVFAIVLFLEKIKEKMDQQVNMETPIEQTPPTITPQAPQNPQQSTTQTPPTTLNSQTISPQQQQVK